MKFVKRLARALVNLTLMAVVILLVLFLLGLVLGFSPSQSAAQCMWGDSQAGVSIQRCNGTFKILAESNLVETYTTHGENHTISPSGRYVAVVEGESLLIFDLADTVRGFRSVELQAPLELMYWIEDTLMLYHRDGSIVAFDNFDFMNPQ